MHIQMLRAQIEETKPRKPRLLYCCHRLCNAAVWWTIFNIVWENLFAPILEKVFWDVDVRSV